MENSNKFKRQLAKMRECKVGVAAGVGNIRLPLVLLSTERLEAMLKDLEGEDIKIRRQIRTIKYILISRKED